jgi:curved DNA-binding protein CbpA
LNQSDKNRDDPNAEKKFVEVTNAYHILSDTEKRKLFDQFGEAGINPQAGSQRPGGAPSGFPGGFGFPGKVTLLFFFCFIVYFRVMIKEVVVDRIRFSFLVPEQILDFKMHRKFSNGSLFLFYFIFSF